MWDVVYPLLTEQCRTVHALNRHRLHDKEINDIEDDQERHRRLVELNVAEQCLNVYVTPARIAMSHLPPRIATYVTSWCVGYPLSVVSGTRMARCSVSVKPPDNRQEMLTPVSTASSLTRPKAY